MFCYVQQLHIGDANETECSLKCSVVELIILVLLIIHNLPTHQANLLIVGHNIWSNLIYKVKCFGVLKPVCGQHMEK